MWPLGVAFSSLCMGSAANLIAKITDAIINPLIILLFALALLMFFWGAAQFMLNVNDEQGKANGRRHMLWGIIGMVIMFSVFAILAAILNTFDACPPGLPRLNCWKSVV